MKISLYFYNIYYFVFLSSGGAASCNLVNFLGLQVDFREQSLWFERETCVMYGCRA